MPEPYQGYREFTQGPATQGLEEAFLAPYIPLEVTACQVPVQGQPNPNTIG